MARDAPHFRQTFAVIGVGGKRGCGSQDRGKHQTKAKQLHANLHHELWADRSACTVKMMELVENCKLDAGQRPLFCSPRYCIKHTRGSHAWHGPNCRK
jgi:hypothetical protein